MDQDAPSSSTQSAPASRGANQDAPSPPVLIPDHELLRCIGQGSYGEVWLARNMMGIYRAVKIVHRKSFQHQRPFEREWSGIRKFEPVSRSHEGFIDVLQVGIHEEQGYFYYVMELGDDQLLGQNFTPASYSPKTLAKEISHREKLSFQDCLELGLALSQALAELHKHGLVHRDVKPSNIIFVNGVPKLADIGLVADTNEARSYVGTEGFIPPEGPGRPQADVYGLGKVLYEASTGRDRQDFPELPTQLDKFNNPEGLLELNEVILHACKNDLTKRYQSAWDMHADLLVLANGKSVKRLKVLEHRFSALKRIAGLSALVLTILAAAAYHVHRERRAALDARQRRVDANIVSGNRALESGDLLGSLPYFADALREDRRNPDASTVHRFRFGSVLAQSPKLTQMWFQGTRVNSGQFSPDGRRLLIAERFGQAAIHDLETGAIDSHPFGHAGGLSSAAFSSDARLVLTAHEDRSACVWDAATLEEVCHLPHPERVFSARADPAGRRVITAGSDGVVRVFDARSGQLELSLNRHTNGVRFADFSHDGQLIVTASEDHTALILNATTGDPVTKPLQHDNWVTYADFSPDDQKVVTACADHTAQVWDVATGRRLSQGLEHRDAVRTAVFSPDGRLILTASFDGTAAIWLAEKMEPLATISILEHGEPLTHGAFSPEGRRFLTTCTDGAVRVWDLAASATPRLHARLSISQDGSRYAGVTANNLEVRDGRSETAKPTLINAGSSVEKAVLSRNGAFVATVSLAPTNSHRAIRILQVWNAVTGEAIGTQLSFSNSLAGVSLSDDGQRLVAFGGKLAHVWNVSVANVPRSLIHTEPVGSAFFSPDGTHIAVRSGQEVHVWDLATGQNPFKALEHPQPVRHAEYSPNGAYLVTCCRDDLRTKCYAQVWDAATGRPVGQKLGHRDGILFASFSPDGRRLVTASEDFAAIVWDITTGQPLAAPLRHNHQVQTAAFSPDAKWIVTASTDKTVRVWNAETGDPLTPPMLHPTTLRSAQFLGDGRRLATTGRGGLTRLCRFPFDERPVEDLILLGRLLSGNGVAPIGQGSPSQSESLDSLWQRLRTQYPSDFTPSTEDIVAWHEFQAEESEALHEWAAAAFHLQYLLSLRPNHPALAQRLACVKEFLKTP